MQVTVVLIDQGLLPIEDIPELPKTAREVLPMVVLILKCLQEALASGTGPWANLRGGHHAHDFMSSAPSLYCYPFFCFIP
jgi:hypothetical protein